MMPRIWLFALLILSLTALAAPVALASAESDSPVSTSDPVSVAQPADTPAERGDSVKFGDITGSEVSIHQQGGSGKYTVVAGR